MSVADLRGQAKRRTPEETVEHLKNFDLDLKFSAGVWFFAPGGGRFHDRYMEDKSIEWRLDVAAKLADYGLSGLEAHYPNEVNEENLELYRQLEKDTGVRLITIVPNLFYDAPFEFGALSSPIEKVRKQAIERTKRTLELNREIGSEFAIVTHETTMVNCDHPPAFVTFYDMRNINNPIPVSTFMPHETDPIEMRPVDKKWSQTGSRYGAHNVWLDMTKDDLMYICWFNAGLRIVDWSNPFSPKEVGYYIPEGTKERCCPHDPYVRALLLGQP